MLRRAAVGGEAGSADHRFCGPRLFRSHYRPTPVFSPGVESKGCRFTAFATLRLLTLNNSFVMNTGKCHTGRLHAISSPRPHCRKSWLAQSEALRSAGVMDSANAELRSAPAGEGGRQSTGSPAAFDPACAAVSSRRQFQGKTAEESKARTAAGYPPAQLSPALDSVEISQERSETASPITVR